MFVEAPGLCMPSLGKQGRGGRDNFPWEGIWRGTSGRKGGHDQRGSCLRELVSKDGSVLFVICIVPSLQTSSGSIEEAEGKLDGAWVSQFVLGMCWERSRRERIHNYALLLFNEGRVHLVNFPG